MTDYLVVKGTVNLNGLDYGFEAGIRKIPETYGTDADGNRGELRYQVELDEINFIEDENHLEVQESPELYELIQEAISNGDYQEL